MKDIKNDTEAFYIDERKLMQGEYKSYHSYSKLHLHCFYVDDKLQGECKSYHRNGELQDHCFYVDNILQGEFKSYRDNGELQDHCFYVDNKLQGELKSYRENGELLLHCFFVDSVDVTDEVKPLVRDISNITSEEKVILKLTLGFDL